MTKFKLRDGRPTFFYNNNQHYEIRAGGIIFYRYNYRKDQLEFLMIKNNNCYEDFGGKTDIVDKCIEDTVSREAEEESNGIFIKRDIARHVNTIETLLNPLTCMVSYTKQSKYVVFLIKTTKNYNPADFGDREYHDNIPRTVEWVSASKLLDSMFVRTNLHVRLKFDNFFDTIKNIQSIFTETAY